MEHPDDRSARTHAQRHQTRHSGRHAPRRGAAERPRSGHHLALGAHEHPGILLALFVTALLLPLLLIGRMRTATAMPRTVQVTSVAGPTTTGQVTTAPAPTTAPSTTAPATTVAPPTTVHHVAPSTTTSTVAPRRPAPATTTTTAAPRMPVPPPTTAAPRPAPAPVAAHRQSGGGTWYKFHPGTCAHKTLPFGTVVHITDVANGRTATCVVSDRGPYAAGRILDMDPSVFSQLAPLGTGVINIVITW